MFEYVFGEIVDCIGCGYEFGVCFVEDDQDVGGYMFDEGCEFGVCDDWVGWVVWCVQDDGFGVVGYCVGYGVEVVVGVGCQWYLYFGCFCDEWQVWVCFEGMLCVYDFVVDGGCGEDQLVQD